MDGCNARGRGVLTGGLLALALSLGLPSLLGPLPDPAAARAQTAAPARSVKVAAGDTLESIAARYGVSLEELLRLNRQVKPEALQIGQLIRLPPSSRSVQIAAGDTLDTIAARNGTTAAALQQANPGVKPTQLKVGSWLRLPAGTTAKPAAKPAAAKPAAAKPAAAKPTPAKPVATAAKPTTPLQPPAPKPAVVPPAPELPPAPAASPAVLTPPPAGQARWRYFGNTLVDWGGWKLHPGGLRVTLVQPAAADVGPVRAAATAVAVECASLRQTWRIAGAWEPWASPEPRSVGQQIVLDLCANVRDPAATPVPPPTPPAP